MIRKVSMVLLSFVLFVFAGCGQNNIFSWAHSPGSTSSKASLTTDASQALQNKDYAKALEYYTKLINDNPNNAEAIYGYCSAELASSGLDIAGLVSNLVAQGNSGSSSAPYNRLSPALGYAAHVSASPTGSLLPDSILRNKIAIKASVNKVLGSNYLLKIVQGKGDSTIAPDNPDVNINIAFCLVLLAALKVHDSGLLVFNSDYSVTVAAGSSVSDPAVILVANDAGRDVISAYFRLKAVASKLGLGSDAMISKIQKDVEALFNDLKNQVPGINVNLNTDYYLSGQF